MLYSTGDFNREVPLQSTKKDLLLRPPFRRDFARLIHSPVFRRLQGKTQLFPGIESDFFRNRLTHSLEVAQIAKSIAIRINEKKLIGKSSKDKINLDLVEFAGLAHDLGHPPFGHNGEKALDECMRDAGGFEGNAQTLRILAKLEKKGGSVNPFSGPNNSDSRIGLNLTHRALASVLKYNKIIPIKNSERTPKSDGVMKGYYNSEAELVENIKKNVVGSTGYVGEFKTIECQIMDLADDIAYSTYDLEDALKAGFISPIEILNDALDEKLMEKVAKKVSEKTNNSFSVEDANAALCELFFHSGLFPEAEIMEELRNAKTSNKKYESVATRAVLSYEASLSICQNGYYRNALTSKLVDKFINGMEYDWNPDAPAFSKVKFSKEIFPLVETLKNYTFEKLIQSSRLKVAEFRGFQIVKELFDTLNNDGAMLLPDDFKDWYDATTIDFERKRVICDFIAGMTDGYAIEFYGRLKSENPQSIFKPM